MKTNFAKLSLAVMLLCFTVVIMNGCKKMDEQSAASLEDSKAKAMADLKILLKNNPDFKKVVIPLNIKAETFYVDADGNKINPNETNSYTYQCGSYDYVPAGILVSLTREYQCGSGYRFSAIWNVSAPLLLFTSYNGLDSKGRIRIRNLAGTTVYYQPTITPVSIIDLGDDPETENINKLYRFEYTTEWIPFSVFTSDIKPIEHTFFASTDCSFLPQVFGTANSPALQSVLNPCNRIDPVAIGRPEMNGSTYNTYGDLNGYGNILFTGGCPPPTGSTMPDRQQVQLRCVEPGYVEAFRDISPQQGAWPGSILTSGTLPTSFSSATQSGTIGLYDTYYIPDGDIKPIILGVPSSVPVHGNYKVRYRNKMNGGCLGPWSAEIAAVF